MLKVHIVTQVLARRLPSSLGESQPNDATKDSSVCEGTISSLPFYHMLFGCHTQIGSANSHTRGYLPLIDVLTRCHGSLAEMADRLSIRVMHASTYQRCAMRGCAACHDSARLPISLAIRRDYVEMIGSLIHVGCRPLDATTGQDIGIALNEF